MKKSLWMLGMAVAALTSCTQNEVLEIPESRTIGFDSFVGKQTRAIDDVGDNSNFNMFKVYAAKGVNNGTDFTPDTDGGAYFDGTKPIYRTKTGSEWNSWTYDGKMPWIVNKAFRFAAYANGYATGVTAVDEVGLGSNGTIAFHSNMDVTTTLDGGTLTNTWGFKLENYQANTTPVKDLVFAVSKEENRKSTAELLAPVNFTFQHALAKVVFRFMLDQTSGQNLKVNIGDFELDAIVQSDCLIYNAKPDSIAPVTEINWYSQKMAVTQVNDNTQHNIKAGKYTVVGSEGIMLERDKKDGGIVEDDQSVAFYVIPQSNDITVTFTAVSTASDGSNSATVGTTTFNNVSLKIPNHTEWKPGYVYRYVANLNPQINYIHFSASVDAWKDESNRDQGIVGSSSSSTANNDSGSDNP